MRNLEICRRPPAFALADRLRGHTIRGMDVSNLARIFRENVIRVLAEKNISRNELARRTEMHQPGITAMLNGSAEVRTDTIEKIAIALEVSPDELLHEMAHS